MASETDDAQGAQELEEGQEPEEGPEPADEAAVPDADSSGDGHRSGRRRLGLDPMGPLVAWMSAVQELSSAALGSGDLLNHLGQAQWRMLREGMLLMSDLPLQALEDGTKGLSQLREALQLVRTQMAVVDEQLAAAERVLGPVHEWSRAWTELMGRETPKQSRGS